MRRLIQACGPATDKALSPNDSEYAALTFESSTRLICIAAHTAKPCMKP